MKAPALLTAFAVAVSVVANPLQAQVKQEKTEKTEKTEKQERTESLGANTSWETRAETMLLASDSLALVEMSTVLRQGIALAEIGQRRATNPEVKKLAMKIHKEQAANMEDLNRIADNLRQSTAGMGMDSSEVNMPDAIGAVAVYTRDTVPAFRMVEEGVYKLDPEPVYRRRTVAVIPIETRIERFEADTTESSSHHRAAIEGMEGLSGEAFDNAYLEAQIEFAQWRTDHLHDHIMLIVWNDDLGNVANDIQEALGIHMRNAKDVRDEIN